MRGMVASVLGCLVAACIGPAETPVPEEAAAPAVMEPMAEDTLVVEDTTPDSEPLAESPQTGEVKPEMDPLDRVEDTCGLDALTPHVGKDVADIPPEIVPDTARIVGPDTNVTMDYVPTRLNILTDGEGTIIGLKCG